MFRVFRYSHHLLSFKWVRVQNVYLLIASVSLLPFLVMGFLREFELFEFIELQTLDERLGLPSTHSRHISPLISLIEINAQSEEVIQPLPWPPEIYASLLRNLQEANPIAIGLIAWFNREWPGEQHLPGEKLFAIQPYSPVKNAGNRRAFPEVANWNELPRSLHHAQGGSSFSEFSLNRSDGIYRSARLVVKHGGENDYRFSLEMLILCQIHGVPVTSLTVKEGFLLGKFLQLTLPSGVPIHIPIDSQGRLFLRFVGDISEFPHTSFDKALDQSDTDNPEFQRTYDGQSVLIGITTASTPLASTPIGKMSALALRANLLNTLLNQDFIWRLSRNANLLYLACFGIAAGIAAIFICRTGHSYRLMLLIASGLLFLHFLCVVAMIVLFNIWIEFTATSLALILCGVATSLFLAHFRLRQLFTQLQSTRADLIRAEKEAVFGVMSARVRHELRNALNLVRAPAEMIRNNFLKHDPLNLQERPEEIIGEMDGIIGHVTKLDGMIENELSFFQNTQLNIQHQELEPILDSALKMVEPLIAEKQIKVQLDFPRETPKVSVDIDKMRIVFVNLIKNACQAMAMGGELEISIETPYKTASHAETCVLINDTGAGIPVDELERIFEPFYTTKARGLGLGLVNVKNIVEGHGGEVRVESVVGVGTTFFVQLPANQEKEKT